MAVYVDDLFEYPGKGRWCHMVSTDLEELHAMAARIGLRREWFQNHPRHPHYDLRPFSRSLAVMHGAVEVSSEEIVRIIKTAGWG
jgi:hypothetical protein